MVRSSPTPEDQFLDSSEKATEWQTFQRSGKIQNSRLAKTVVVLTLKRSRSSDNSDSCKRCLRTRHRAEGCQHQLTCRRCSGAGHIAAKCPLRSPSDTAQELERKKARSRRTFLEAKPLIHVPPSLETSSDLPKATLLRISLPITEATIKSKEDLRKMVIIKVLSGNASVRSLLTTLLEMLNPNHCGNITAYDDHFLLSMTSMRVVNTAVKKSPVTFNSPFGRCTVGLSPWTPEFGFHALAVGNYHWIWLSNMPLHCWNWDSIVAILSPLGELIYV